MKTDIMRPNKTIKRIQLCFAQRKAISSLGTPYIKGTEILHCSSNRCTGEIFTFTKKELLEFLNKRIGKFIRIENERNKKN